MSEQSVVTVVVPESAASAAAKAAFLGEVHAAHTAAESIAVCPAPDAEDVALADAKWEELRDKAVDAFVRGVRGGAVGNASTADMVDRYLKARHKAGHTDRAASLTIVEGRITEQCAKKVNMHKLTRGGAAVRLCSGRNTARSAIADAPHTIAWYLVADYLGNLVERTSADALPDVWELKAKVTVEAARGIWERLSTVGYTGDELEAACTAALGKPAKVSKPAEQPAPATGTVVVGTDMAKDAKATEKPVTVVGPSGSPVVVGDAKADAKADMAAEGTDDETTDDGKPLVNTTVDDAKHAAQKSQDPRTAAMSALEMMKQCTDWRAALKHFATHGLSSGDMVDLLDGILAKPMAEAVDVLSTLEECVDDAQTELLESASKQAA